MLKTIDRYIFTEFLTPFFIGLATLNFALFTFEMLRFAKVFAGKGVMLMSFGRVIIDLAPSFLAFTIPTACLIASITAYTRLSYDREIVALWAAGLSLMRLSTPALVFSFLAFSLAMVLSQSGHPLTGPDFQSLAKSLARDQLTLALEPGVWNEPIKDMLVFVPEVEPEHNSKRVFIHDQRSSSEPLILVARSYEVSHQPDPGQVMVRLRDGTLHYAARNLEEYHQVKFSTYAWRFDLAQFLGPPARVHQNRNATLEQLRRSGWNDRVALRQLTQYHRELAFPVASIIFGMLGVPLGILSQPRKGVGLATGPVFGVVIFALYYLLNVLGEIMVIKLGVHPLAGAWLPNTIMLGITTILFVEADGR